MTTITGSERRPRSLLGKVIVTLQARSRARTGRSSRLAAAVQDHAMTFAAMAAVNFGVFHLSVAAGWIFVGVSLIIADYKIQD